MSNKRLFKRGDEITAMLSQFDPDLKHNKKAIDDSIVVGAALDELTDAEKSVRALFRKYHGKKVKSRDAALKLLMELQESFYHLKTHCDDASLALIRLAGKVDTPPPKSS